MNYVALHSCFEKKYLFIIKICIKYILRFKHFSYPAYDHTTVLTHLQFSSRHSCKCFVRRLLGLCSQVSYAYWLPQINTAVFDYIMKVELIDIPRKGISCFSRILSYCWPFFGYQKVIWPFLENSVAFNFNRRFARNPGDQRLAMVTNTTCSSPLRM